jgi:hypothetical protein
MPVLSARGGQATSISLRFARRAAQLAWMPARQMAIVLSVYASLLHDWVIPEHYREWWGYGAYFLAAAAAQAFLGGLLLFWPNRRVCLMGIVGNCAILILYVVTRTVGIPFFGPAAGRVEPVGSLDLAAAAAEIGLVAVLLRHVMRNDRRECHESVEDFQTRRPEAERPQRGVIAAAPRAPGLEPGG